MSASPHVYRGFPIDEQSRCRHWHSALDVVAFRFPCCVGWWPCVQCHEETEAHAAVPWPAVRQGETSVLCGVCRAELTVAAYVACHSRCPRCNAAFNPGCNAHWPRYFAGVGGSK